MDEVCVGVTGFAVVVVVVAVDWLVFGIRDGDELRAGLLQLVAIVDLYKNLCFIVFVGRVYCLCEI